MDDTERELRRHIVAVERDLALMTGILIGLGAGVVFMCLVIIGSSEAAPPPKKPAPAVRKATPVKAERVRTRVTNECPDC